MTGIGEGYPESKPPPVSLDVSHEKPAHCVKNAPSNFAGDTITPEAETVALSERSMPEKGSLSLEKVTSIPEVGEELDNTNSSHGKQQITESADEHLHGLKLLLMTFSLMMAVFVMGLDKTVITTAIPKITSEFHSLQDVGWYGSSYLLTLMALQPTFGKIYTYFDIKRVFICALLIFESGSIVCATAPNSEAFIVGRAIAGIGSAGLVQIDVEVLLLDKSS